MRLCQLNDAVGPAKRYGGVKRLTWAQRYTARCSVKSTGEKIFVAIVAGGGMEELDNATPEAET
jgi:hypothetical protein